MRMQMCWSSSQGASALCLAPREKATLLLQLEWTDGQMDTGTPDFHLNHHTVVAACPASECACCSAAPTLFLWKSKLCDLLFFFLQILMLEQLCLWLLALLANQCLLKTNLHCWLLPLCSKSVFLLIKVFCQAAAFAAQACFSYCLYICWGTEIASNSKRELWTFRDMHHALSLCPEERACHSAFKSLNPTSVFVSNKDDAAWFSGNCRHLKQSSGII